jgi:predicted PP-loop superfamily ATPase
MTKFTSNEEATKRKENRIIESLSPDIGTLRLTKTMLDKHIIDANASIRRLALLLGHDMESMTNGDKITIEGQYDDGTPCRVNLYRTVMRSDRRVSISGIKKQAIAGDLLALSYKRNDEGDYILIINVTAAAHCRVTQVS